jgi:putative endonuclease
MGVWGKIKSLFGDDRPQHLRHGELGEGAAKKHLKQRGLKYLTANFRDKYGEIDLIFRDGDVLAFVEVKTRSSEEWTRPADAVDLKKQRRLTRTADGYLRKIGYPEVSHRFDIVEVLLRNGEVDDIRHLPDAFPPAD